MEVTVKTTGADVGEPACKMVPACRLGIEDKCIKIPNHHGIGLRIVAKSVSGCGNTLRVHGRTGHGSRVDARDSKVTRTTNGKVAAELDPRAVRGKRAKVRL